VGYPIKEIDILEEMVILVDMVKKDIDIN